MNEHRISALERRIAHLERRLQTVVDTSGEVRLQRTVWEDLAPNAPTVGPGASGPAFTVYNGTLRAYEFVHTAARGLLMEFQMPHKWKLGSTICPHIHLYVPTDVTGGTVEFSQTYTWTNIDAAEVSEQVSYGTLVVAGSAGNVHRLLTLPNLAGTGKTLSSVLTLRITREIGRGVDTFGASVWLKAADIHVEIDSLGSRDEYVK